MWLGPILYRGTGARAEGLEPTPTHSVYIPRPAHRWSVTPAQVIAIQKRLAGHVLRHRPTGRIRYVAGVDAAFPGGDTCVTAAVVWDLRRAHAVEEACASRPLRFPYVPGLLSFREAPAILAALRRLKTPVDALMCDGHGLAHPRGFGLACHLGVLCDLPCIGCAKSRLVGDHAAPAVVRGARVPLRHRGRVVGTVLRTKDGVNPIYVSIGHRMDLRAAASLALRCVTRYRLPEPTRLADRLVSRWSRKAAAATGAGG